MAFTKRLLFSIFAKFIINSLPRIQQKKFKLPTNLYYWFELNFNIISAYLIPMYFLQVSVDKYTKGNHMQGFVEPSKIVLSWDRFEMYVYHFYFLEFQHNEENHIRASTGFKGRKGKSQTISKMSTKNKSVSTVWKSFTDRPQKIKKFLICILNLNSNLFFSFL